MTATVDFEDDAFAPQEFRPEVPSEDADSVAMAVVYQQIADRRAQLENADILRRARAL